MGKIIYNGRSVEEAVVAIGNDLTENQNSLEKQLGRISVKDIVESAKDGTITFDEGIALLQSAKSLKLKSDVVEKDNNPLHIGDITYERYVSVKSYVRYGVYVTDNLGWNWKLSTNTEEDASSYCEDYENRGEGLYQEGFGVYKVVSRPDDYS